MLRKNGLFLLVIALAFSTAACELFQDSIGEGTYFVGVWQDNTGGEGKFTFRSDGTWTRVGDISGNYDGTFSARGNATSGVLVLKSDEISLFPGEHEYVFNTDGTEVEITWENYILGDLEGKSVLVKQ